jgi:hypothetical protein
VYWPQIRCGGIEKRREEKRREEKRREEKRREEKRREEKRREEKRREELFFYSTRAFMANYKLTLPVLDGSEF